MGMLAPELVVYAAWKQWYDAKEMTTKINGLLDEVSIWQLTDKILSKEIDYTV